LAVAALSSRRRPALTLAKPDAGAAAVLVDKLDPCFFYSQLYLGNCIDPSAQFAIS
jgi:hypothetical protein